LLDSDDHLIEVNAGWLAMLGYARENVIGRWFGDFLSPDSVKDFKSSFSRFKAAGETWAARFVKVRKDNSLIDVEIEGIIANGNEGQFKQSYGVIRNITEFVEAVRQLGVFRA
jgi:PAS domain S-box-containing protein